MQTPPVASTSSSASRMSTNKAAARPSPATNPKTPFLSPFPENNLSRFSYILPTLTPNPASSLLSSECKREPFPSPFSQPKDVLLFEWWLMKTEKGYEGKRLAVGGFTKRNEVVLIFASAPIIKRHDNFTLETADGITVRIHGAMNKTRTCDNGFPLEVSVAFFFGFPTTWDTFIGDSFGDKPAHQPEITFDPSSQKITVLLTNWWLRRAEKGPDGHTLAVGGFSEGVRGKATRIYNSSPITKRHDVCTIETADGITVRIQGFIDKTRTLNNGFSLEACKIFFIGFPTTWTKFSILSSGDKPSHSETPVSSSISADWYKDFLESLPFGTPGPSENTILENVPLISKTSIYDFAATLLKAIYARGSIPSSVHSPLVDKGSHHFPSTKLRDNNCVKSDKICGTNVTYAQTVGNEYEYHVAECPPKISVDHEKLDFIQEETLKNSKKCTGHALTTGHHDELVKLCNSQPNETLIEGSPSSSISSREDQIFGESPAEPAVRSGEKLELLTAGNVHGESQDCSQFLDETNNVNCINFSPRGPKISATSQLNDALVQGRTLSPNLHGKNQESVSSAKHASENYILSSALDGSKTHVTSLPSETVLTESILSPTESILFPSAGVLSEEIQDGHQHSNIEIVSNSNSVSKYDSPSTACLWKNLNDQRTFSCDPTVGIVDEAPPNPKAFASPTLGKNILRHCKNIKDNQTVRSRKEVEQNDSRNEQDFSNVEGNMSISSASNLRRKTKKIGVSTDMGTSKFKRLRAAGCQTVWVSSYTDVRRSLLTQRKGIDLSVLTPESVSLKRSRSGRVLLPALDCSTRVIYEADGSIAGTASVDGSIAQTLSQCKGSRTTPNTGMKRKKQANK